MRLLARVGAHQVHLVAGWALAGSGRCAAQFARGPPPDSNYPEAPAKNIPGVPSFVIKRASTGDPGGPAGLGGHSPCQVDGPGGRSLDPGGVRPNSLGVPPPDCEYPGAPAKILLGVPPSAGNDACGGGLVGLVARVGAHRVKLMARVGARCVGAVCPPIR